MKIIKLGEVIAELRDEPKDFEGGNKGGVLWLVVGDSDVTLAKYATTERAQEICHKIHDAYFAGEEEIILPEE